MPALADDAGGNQRRTQIAALGDNGAETLTFGLGLPPRPKEVGADLKVLLAQNGRQVASDASPDEILVALASSAPQSIDDEIAKQHGLELIDSVELSSLGLRVVRYRAPGNGPVAAILAELATDPRIRRAQVNAEYRAVPPRAAPATVVVGPKPGPPAAAADRRLPSTARRPIGAEKLAKVGVLPQPETAGARQAVRVGRVGDVLSGGL